MYRNVPCPREDCGEMVQAHLLKDHMKYSCSSKMYHRRMWLIRRGRKRKNYARPWGIEIPLNDSDEEGDDSSVEYGTHSMSRPTTGNTQRDTRSSPEAGVFGSPNTARATSASSRPSGSPSRPEVSS